MRCKERDESVFTMLDSIKLLQDLQRQAVCLESVYTVQMQLFGAGPENVELLNRSGSNVFAYLELRWPRLVGQLGGLFKVYSDCHSYRQNLLGQIFLSLLLRL